MGYLLELLYWDKFYTRITDKFFYDRLERSANARGMQAKVSCYRKGIINAVFHFSISLIYIQ